MNKLLFKGGLFILLISILHACDSTEKKVGTSSATKQVVSDSLPWSERMAQSIMLRHPELWTTENAEEVKWNYKTGLLATAFLELYEESGNEEYFAYVKEYADDVIDENGKILNYKMEDYNIDNINAGKMLFQVYEQTKDPKYKIALDTLFKQYSGHPRTPSGGLWHKKIYPNQMWLDGLYMGAPFFTEYNVTFGEGEIIDDIIMQFRLIYNKTYDEETGLLYHAWDESKKMEWADNKTGLSPNFWSRAMGWYMMALVDVLDLIPEDHKGRGELINYLNELSEALAKQQDESGLWYQVTDLHDKEGNYLETSSTSMFIYAWAKGVKEGYLPQKYQTLAQKAYDGMTTKFTTVDPDGKVNITNVCKSAGLGGDPYRDGSFEYYISEPIRVNHLHGTGPFILASIYMNQ